MKFNEGDRVVVVSDKYKGLNLYEYGTVESIFTIQTPELYGVRVDSRENLASAKGLFWYEANGLKHADCEVESEEVFMFNNFVVANVSFLDTNNYSDVALYDSSIVEGDTVVVSTQHHGFALAKVCKIYLGDETKKKVREGREVVCKVDFSAYEYRQETAKRMKELKSLMDKKVKEAQALAVYEFLAEKDDSFKAILDEFKELTSLATGSTNTEHK